MFTLEWVKLTNVDPYFTWINGYRGLRNVYFSMLEVKIKICVVHNFERIFLFFIKEQDSSLVINKKYFFGDKLVCMNLDSERISTKSHSSEGLIRF